MQSAPSLNVSLNFFLILLAVPSGPDNTIEPIMCNFEEFGNSMGLYVNDTFVMCVSPRISGHPDDYYREEVTVRVAINGQDFTSIESEAVVTFVGTGAAKGFLNFIIATILIALLIIALVFLVIVLTMGEKNKKPNVRTEVRENNNYVAPLGRSSQGGDYRPKSAAQQRGASRQLSRQGRF